MRKAKIIAFSFHPRHRNDDRCDCPVARGRAGRTDRIILIAGASFPHTYPLAGMALGHYAFTATHRHNPASGASLQRRPIAHTGAFQCE